MVNIRLLDLSQLPRHLYLNVTSGGEQLWDENFVSMAKWLAVEIKARLAQGHEALCQLVKSLVCVFSFLVHYLIIPFPVRGTPEWPCAVQPLASSCALTD